MTQQETNFRAFNRLLLGIDLSEITEKWELEDELRNIQSKWNAIDNLHLQIDNFLQGEDKTYEERLSQVEAAYKNIKRELNRKLSSTAHLQQSTPQLEIPIFTGKYTQWPTFYDLYCEAIHNSTLLTKTQKMQHLKGKVKGEAERLIQHLHITAENYDIAWELLIHRYNNPQVLFSKQIDIFLNQPTIQKQTAFELKRLYDTSTECIHAIHNLGIDTTTWDPLLVHLISKKLDLETYTDYKEARKHPRELPTLDELMAFLESKFTALETIHHKRDRAAPLISKPPPNNRHSLEKTFNRTNYQKSYPAYTVSVPTSNRCPFCNQEHELFQCKNFISMNAEQRLRSVTKLHVCQNCLHVHRNSKCHSIKRCKECNGMHNTMLHDSVEPRRSSAAKTSQSVAPMTSSNVPTSSKQHNVNHVASEDEEILLTTLLLKIKAANGKYVTLRALLDQGSQISLITERAAQLLGLKRQSYRASVLGVGNGTKQSKGAVTIQCQSIHDDFSFVTKALVVTKLINNLPTSSFTKQAWPHLQNINLADPEYNISKPTDLLLDASVYSDIIMSGLIKGPARAPIAQQTRLGWILSGNVQTKTFNCHVVINNLEDIAKYWELEDVIDSSSLHLTPEEQYCEEYYKTTTKRLENGRYQVALPMKPGYAANIGQSKFKAIGQFRQLENKLSRNPQLADDYKAFMDEYRNQGHMRIAHKTHLLPYYLPHHGVLRLESTTTKLRVVFNASAKTSSGHSLNDVMECGPNLQKDLMGLILQWRHYTYVLTADIEKMYRQILVREDDHHLQRIIWRDSPQEAMQEYELTTVTYGTKAAPFLAMRTLQQLAQDEAARYPLAASAVEHSFYMDDLLSGHCDLDQAKELRRQLIAIMNSAGMNLRKWSSNTPELVEDLTADQLNAPFDFKCTETRKTLGLRWNSQPDTFTFHSHELQAKKGNLTKRELLSEISKLFDPLGWLSPISIRAKLLFQKAWTNEISWDDELSLDIQQEWIALRTDFENINQFSIPRYLGNLLQNFEIHCFCDASEKAYACVVYIVTTNNKGVRTSNIVAAKTKLAPLKKKVSLPRLELCGALLASQLVNKVLQAIPHEKASIFAWTDSMVVLGWLQGNINRWSQFIANRVQQITDVIPASQWHHVKSEENAADGATRGLTSKQLLSDQTLWWRGPQWILNNPKDIIPTQYPEPDIEVKKSKIVAIAQLDTESIIKQLLCAHSSINRVAKIIAWTARFIARCRNPLRQQNVNEAPSESLTSTEINRAYECIIKYDQAIEFTEEIHDLRKLGHVKANSKLANLCPFLDDNGLLRVGGRLKNSNINTTAKHPIILSKQSRFTELVIDQAHKTALHGGAKLTLSCLRDRYWILSGMNTVKKQLRRCVTCRRYNQQNLEQIMADLPKPRVTPSRPFTHCGVDFTGHVEVKANKGRGIKTSKGYIAIFVCLSTKAVHLELVTDLSTPTFLAAFRRMCARRGTPKEMYSDNGTNFIGASKLLKKEYEQAVELINKDFINSISERGINWNFNAPTWASAGGLWESAVRSMKYHLRRVLGTQKLTYEEFTTLLTQIESCLNSRPLCSLSEDPDDIDSLTPGHFLIGGPILSNSHPNSDSEGISLPTRWQLVQTMTRGFWKKWSHEYLQSLQKRSKWLTAKENIKINDVVVVKDENLPPTRWGLGRVMDVHPGKDEHVRVVTLKTKGGVIKRPITKLCLLPVHNQEDIIKNDQDKISPEDVNTTSSSPPESQTAPKRTRRKTSKYSVSSIILTLLSIIAVSTQQEVTSSPSVCNITSLQNKNQSLYFDQVTELQQIIDEWKLVVYYNMSSYWQGLSNMDQYILHLKELCVPNSQYNSIIYQLDHEMQEIRHYNRLLKQHALNRQKRGLINGAGYIANSLFGVLDDRFAQQYEKDILKITRNENHLRNLIRNQTVVLEAEYNVLKRNELNMNKQFSFIKDRLHNISLEMDKVTIDYKDSLYITSSALAASIIISNLRRIQQSLLNTVTDISQGRIDMHLITPEQLDDQINLISSHIRGGLALPVTKDEIKDIYKMLKVSGRVFNNYLIIEIKIPLVSNDIYEVNKIISLPQKSSNRLSYQITSKFPYIAYNIRKDTVIFLSEDDFKSCISASLNRILCTFDKPIYNLSLKKSFCNINISNNDIERGSPCVSSLSTCRDQWTKLHQQNSWLFSCCSECNIRIFCPSTIMSMKTLKDNGIIDIGQGCSLMSDSFSIHAHNKYLNYININNKVEIPQVSVLNKLLNTSIQSYYPPVEDNEQQYSRIKEQIKTIKESQSDQITVHDIHHYTISYIIVVIILAVGSIFVCTKMRSKLRKRSRGATPQQQPAQQQQQGKEGALAPCSRSKLSASVSDVSASVSAVADIARSQSLFNINQGTSPMVPRSIKFNVPCESFLATCVGREPFKPRYGAMPYIVYYPSRYRGMCVGTLVSRVVVLTAAVCVTSPTSEIHDRRPINVITGSTYRHPRRGIRVQVTKILIPRLNNITGNRGYLMEKSAALLLLKRKVPDVMAEIPLRALTVDWKGEEVLSLHEECFMPGWHFFYRGDRIFPIHRFLLQRNVRVQFVNIVKKNLWCEALSIKFQKALSNMGFFGFFDKTGTICVKDPDRIAQPCHGMYGSPLVCRGKAVAMMMAPDAQWKNCTGFSNLVHVLSGNWLKEFMTCVSVLFEPDYHLDWKAMKKSMYEDPDHEHYDYVPAIYDKLNFNAGSTSEETEEEET